MAAVWAGEADPPPLPRAHAHNDYEHARPLHDALERGFCSVESDIYLVEGRLLVAHDRDKVRPDRTLEGLYLEPLLERVTSNQGGVFKGGPPFMLLVDIKSEAEPTYAVLRQALIPYRGMLTRFRAGHIETNAVTLVLSGNRPFEVVAGEEERWVALDGRLPELESDPPRDLYPLISDHWGRTFSWRGAGPMEAGDRDRLAGLVEKAHRQGRILRFWAVPDRREAWQVLHDAGVDLINTDDLDGLRDYLRER